MPFKEQTAARAPFINNSVSRAKRGSKYDWMGGVAEQGEQEEGSKGEECGLHDGPLLLYTNLMVYAFHFINTCTH